MAMPIVCFVTGVTVGFVLSTRLNKTQRVITKVQECVQDATSPSSSTEVPQKRKKKHDGPVIEICLSDIDSVTNAWEGGATSVELCSARSEGGITVSVGLMEQTARLLLCTDVEVHVLIRPRPGNFTYTDSEFDIIVRDIIAAKKAGVDGVVVGFLDSSGNIDKDKLRVARLLSQGMILTFHRAFDLCSNPSESLEDVISLGCDRLLTSGRCSSAGSPEGVESLRVIVEQARGRIQVIAAAGVKSENASTILLGAGVHGLHAGSSVTACTKANTEIQQDKAPRIGLDEHEEINSWPVANMALVRSFVEAASGNT